MTKTTFFLVVAVAGLLLAGPACAAITTLVMIAEVQGALDKGDAQQAANLADKALKEEGMGTDEKGRLLLYRGLAQELLGAHALAMHDFTQALDSHALLPDERAQALLQRGFLHDGLGQLEEAAGDYTAVISIQGEGLATALNNRANIYRRQNKLPQARRDYLAALSAGGGKSQYSYYGLGQIAEAQRDPLAARGFYAKAVDADSGYGLAAERLAALGGPPDDTIADTTPIILHPPPARRSRSIEAAGGLKAATEAIREPDGTILLRAPAAKSNGETVTLHPPGARPSRILTPARSSRAAALGGPILRPALDQPRASMGAEVQLGAWRSEAEANAGWDKAKARAGEALVGLTPHVLAADLPGRGRYYRLRVHPGGGQSEAELCDNLAAKGVACLPVRD